MTLIPFLLLVTTAELHGQNKLSGRRRIRKKMPNASRGSTRRRRWRRRSSTTHSWSCVAKSRVRGAFAFIVPRHTGLARIVIPGESSKNGNFEWREESGISTSSQRTFSCPDELQTTALLLVVEVNRLVNTFANGPWPSWRGMLEMSGLSAQYEW